MKKSVGYKIFLSALLLTSGCLLFAQDPVILPGTRRPSTTPTTGTTFPGNARVPGSSDTTQSNVERRDYSDDSLKVKVYFLWNSRPSVYDTSISDYTTRFPVPATHIYLGNDGSATKSLLFATPPRTGWDPGFHTLDVYKWRPETVRFFNTPKPYTELGYMLAPNQEQMIEILHTQNIRPYWNVAFQYRLLSAPGIFRNRKNNHNNYAVSSWYQSPNKRYNNYVIILNNKLKAVESGGIRADENYLGNSDFSTRYTIPTNLGGDPPGSRPNLPFTTGRSEGESLFMLRQQYDLGKKDSLVTDSTVIPLFYPRLRFEHTLRYSKYSYAFQDYTSPIVGNIPDSVYYKKNYGFTIDGTGDSIYLEDRWRETNNDFSIYQFPEANNLQQFIKAGIEFQLLSATLRSARQSFYNIIAHGEYRNRTRNQKWDLNAFGRLHTAGLNSGDYHAYVSLQRLLSQRLGTLQIGFENINRSPSFIYNQRSSFYLDAAKDFGKENTAHFFAGYYLPKIGVQLTGDYYFVTNYLYLNGYKTLQQDNAVFNLLRVSGFKTFKISRRWNLHSEVYVQQKAGGTEVNVPLIYTRNRLAYEGLLFRNLNLSAGLEIRYHTPYKADNYSPVLGQFFFQDTLTISNRPDVHAFFHMRIRTFKAFIRLENLNTVDFADGFGFSKNSLVAPYYPTPGLLIRFGIYWAFVN